jgi:hypothetical protein
MRANICLVAIDDENQSITNNQDSSSFDNALKIHGLMKRIASGALKQIMLKLAIVITWLYM